MPQPPSNKENASSGGEPLLLDVRQVSHLLGLGERTVWRLSSKGELPPPVSLGRAKRWSRRAIEEHVNSLTAKHAKRKV